MTAEEIAGRYNKLPGFRLVDYHSVALPLWQITFDALVIAEKKCAVVDEFILRAIDRGVDVVDDLAGFLGLSEKLIVRRLGTLAASDMVLSMPGSANGKPGLKLSSRGNDVVREVGKTPPRREKLVIAYDAIARRPITGRIARESYRTPQQMKQYGLFELPALPGRPPDDVELANIDYNSALPKETRKDQKIHQVLSAQKVGTLARRYREAVMLIYSGVADSEQVVVRFFSIDGRPMPEVNEGFQRNHGLQRLGILEQLKKHRATLEGELLLDEGYRAVVEYAKTLPPAEDVSEAIAQAAKLSAAIEERERKVAAENAPEDEVKSLRADIEKLRREKAAAQALAEGTQIRFLEPQEHVQLFQKSLEEAKSRLLIISPWISDKVMEHKWRLLESLLAKGVDVYVGYGITERGPDDRKVEKGARTIAWLEQKAGQYPNLHIEKLGNTHAKVLVVDHRYVVIGSFNWMSFAGFDYNESGHRVIRDERSTMVCVPAKVDEMFEQYVSRFRTRTPDSPGPRPVPKYTISASVHAIQGVGSQMPTAASSLPTRTTGSGTANAPSLMPQTKPAPPTPPVTKVQIRETEARTTKKEEAAPLSLTPRMIAAHVKKKGFEVVALALGKKHFAGLDDPLPDPLTREIYSDLRKPLPSPSELEAMRRTGGFGK